MKTISEWQKEVHALAIEKGWYEGEKRGVPELLCLIHSEISEALECYRKGENRLYHVNGKPEGFPVEVADAVIRILDMCGYLGIDLEFMIENKHEYNKSRPYRHGGKIC